MFVSFSVFFALLNYLRKAFICLWLLVVLSCKDFKSWDSRYSRKVKIKFEPEKDEQIPKVVKDLQSHKLSTLPFVKLPIVTADGGSFSLTNSLTIPLDPNADVISFALTSSLTIPLDPNADVISFALLEDKNNRYYHQVTIYYERKRSLISPKAGGLQIQYLLKKIQFHTQTNKNPIFKRYTIDHPVPLKEDKEAPETHVTLYY